MSLSTVEMAAGGPHLSHIVAGMMNLSSWGLAPAQTLDFVHACLDMGISSFDHADIYGGYTCEAAFGQALALEPGLRPRLQLVTKCGIMLRSPNRPGNQIKHYDTSTAHILASVDNSLRQLHTDYVDLLLIHRPDPLLDADAVAAAFDQLRQAGKVRHFGVSNFTPRQFDLLASRLDYPLVTNQIELSVVRMQALHDGTLDQCQQRRIAPMAWSPLGGGSLFRGEDGQSVRLRHTLGAIGQEVNAPLDQVALAWLLTHPGRVVPVLGTSRLDRLAGAVAATQIALSRQQWFAIWQASAGHEIP